MYLVSYVYILAFGHILGREKCLEIFASKQNQSRLGRAVVCPSHSKIQNKQSWGRGGQSLAEPDNPISYTFGRPNMGPLPEKKGLGAQGWCCFSEARLIASNQKIS